MNCNCIEMLPFEGRNILSTFSYNVYIDKVRHGPGQTYMYFMVDYMYIVFAIRNSLQWSKANRLRYLHDQTIYLIGLRGARYIDSNMNVFTYRCNYQTGSMAQRITRIPSKREFP